MLEWQAAIDAGGEISKAQAIAMGSTNVEKLLGGRVEAEPEDAVQALRREGLRDRVDGGEVLVRRVDAPDRDVVRENGPGDACAVSVLDAEVAWLWRCR